jgi:predicted RNA-binding Zn ribbon-like protein
MKNTITRVDALNIAINSIPMDIENPTEVVEVLTKIRDQIAKPRKTSDEAKAAQSAKRKAATAQARAEMCAQVIPILREVITKDMTAKEIFAAASDRLPEGFTAPKVQNILLREMAPELVKTETKGHANTYRLA